MKKTLLVVFLIFFKVGFSQSDLPVGSIIAFSGDTLTLDSTSWRICNGTPLRIDRFLPLFKVIEWRYGYGGDTTDRNHFSLPDYRGVFLRGSDLLSKRDPNVDERLISFNKKIVVGDMVGSVEYDTIKKHNHEIKDPGHQHRISGGFSINPSGNKPGGDDLSQGKVGTGDKYDATTKTGIIVEDYGGNETRPINISVYWIIKAR